MGNTLNEQAMQSAATAETGCGVCKRKGFPIFLVRKSVMPIHNDQKIGWSKGMPIAELAERLPAEELVAHEYAYRTLRQGYVYVLVKKKSSTGMKRRVISFESLPKGGFRHKSIIEITEKEIEDIPGDKKCVDGNHRLIGQFINIDVDVENVYEDEAWIAYSRRAWTDDVRQYYQNAPESELQRFTKIKFNAETAKKPKEVSSENRSFAFESFLNNEKLLVEFEETNVSDKDHAYLGNINMFNTKSEYNSANENKTKIIINNLQKNNKKLAVVVVEDVFGIANDLNNIRNARLEPYFKAMEDSEKDVTTKFQEGLQKALASDAQTTTKKIGEDDFEAYKLSDPDMELFYKKTNFFNLYSAAMLNARSSGAIINPNQELYNQTYDAEVNYREVIEVTIKQDHKLSNYFAPEMVYQRKIRTWLDNYKLMLEQSYLEQYKDEEQLIYFADNGNPSTFERAPDGSLCFLPVTWDVETQKLYTELPMTQEEKLQAIKSYPYFTPKDVKRYSVQKLKASKSFERKWQEISERINSNVLDTFNKKDQELYEDLLAKLIHLSKDYFVNLTWLFGDKNRSTSAYSLARYNDVNFWEFEFEADGTKSHLGFLNDVNDILSMTYTGTINFQEQFGIWDTLLNSEKSIYFYALTGVRDKKFNETIGKKSANTDNSNSPKGLLNIYQTAYFKVMHNQDNTGKSLTEITKIVVETMNTMGDQKWNHDDVTNFMYFYDRLFNSALEGIANIRNYKTVSLSSGKVNSASAKGLANFTDFISNKELISTHFQNSTQLLSAVAIKVCRVKLTPKEFTKMLADLRNRKVVTISAKSGETFKYQPSLGKEVTVRVNNDGSLSVPGNGNALITTDVVMTASTLQELQTIEQSLSNNSSGELVKDHSGNIIGAGSNSEKIAGDASRTKDILIEREKIKVDAKKAIAVNTVLFILDCISLASTVKALEGAGLGIAEKNKLEMELFKTSLSLINETTEAISAAMKLLLANKQTNIPVFGKEVIQLQKSWAGDISQMAAYLAKTVSFTLSVWSILDGLSGFLDGLERAKNGDAGGLMYSLGSAFQIASGIYGLILTFCTPIPFIGAVMFVIGAVSALLVYVFKDHSEDWSLMEKWVDLCHFGNHDRQSKEPPYTLTPVGLFLCLNHYMTALQGASAVIDYGNDNSLLEDEAKKERQELSWLERQMNKIGTAELQKSNKSVILKMVLPNFDQKNSFFAGSLFILQKGYTNPQSAVLKFERKGEILKIIPPSQSIYSLRVRKLESIEELAKAERYRFRSSVDENGNTDDFLVTIKLAELMSFHDLVLKVTYWPQGKVATESSGSDNSFPLLLNYSYKD